MFGVVESNVIDRGVNHIKYSLIFDALFDKSSTKGKSCTAVQTMVIPNRQRYLVILFKKI
jgi:hypothetical protein